MKPRRRPDITARCNIRPPPGLNCTNSNSPMKTKITLLTALISAGLLTSASTFARGPGGNGGGNRGASRTPNAVCDLSGPGQGTPLRDGSGKATAPGRGPKDGTGNNANCPIPPNG
ncbi:MAG: hypothetical protein QG637_502 [Chloroflexota bacterium]|nr:hypothetical protein [Chloroflexota bacterium]